MLINMRIMDKILTTGEGLGTFDELEEAVGIFLKND